MSAKNPVGDNDNDRIGNPVAVTLSGIQAAACGDGDSANGFRIARIAARFRTGWRSVATLLSTTPLLRMGFGRWPVGDRLST
jgi:hypothetical protein